MKDMILSIKRKAIALDLDSDYTDIENQLIDLKQQIKILDSYLSLNMRIWKVRAWNDIKKDSLLLSF